MFHKVIHKLSKASGLLLAVTLAAVVGGATTAFVMAAIPGSDGTISACYNKKNGTLKVIDAESGAACTSKQNPLSWSQNGGHVVSNHLSISVSDPDQGTTSDEPLLSLPGFGEITVDAGSCSSATSGTPTLSYTNNTLNTVEIAGQDVGSPETIAPGQSAPNSDDLGGPNTVYPMQLTYSSSGIKYVATLTTSGEGANYNEVSYTTCDVLAQAIISQSSD